MFVTRSIRALDFTELTLEAFVDQLVLMRFVQLPDIAVSVIDCLEEVRKCIAVFKAHSATVTDLDRTGHFLIERFLVPIKGICRVVGKTIAGEI